LLYQKDIAKSNFWQTFSEQTLGRFGQAGLSTADGRKRKIWRKTGVIDEKDRQIEKLQSELKRLRNWDEFASMVEIEEIDERKFAYAL